MHLMPKLTLCENINKLWVQVYEINADNDYVTDKIPNPETQQEN